VSGEVAGQEGDPPPVQREADGDCALVAADAQHPCSDAGCGYLAHHLSQLLLNVETYCKNVELLNANVMW
jgi:hypothetical protein